MFFVFGGALLWWGALGDLMVWGVLAGGGSYVLEGCSSVLGPAVCELDTRDVACPGESWVRTWPHDSPAPGPRVAGHARWPYPASCVRT